MAKGLYKFYWDCGRQGDLEGIFVSDSESVAGIVGKQVYFGEVLGKHSEVYGKIDDGDIKLITDDTIAVSVVEQYGLSTGFNPFAYLGDDEEPEDE